jgi:hypothetical protein
MGESEGAVGLEAEAREMGWSPKEEFKGDPEKWVDAETYVERGKTVLPIVTATNKKLREELAEVNRKLAEQAEQNRVAAENLKALQDSAADMAKLQYKRALESLKAQKKDALAQGDHDAVVEIDEAVAELKAKGEPKAPAVAAPAKPAQTGPVDFNAQYFKEFKARNPWLDADVAKTSWAAAKSMEFVRAGLTGPEIVAKVEEAYSEIWGEKPRRGDKMEGSRGGAGTPSGRAGNGRSWGDIPAEDQKVALKQADRLVGKGKIHETLDSWKKSFTEQYFNM